MSAENAVELERPSESFPGWKKLFEGMKILRIT
jgi:hypothetical protein